MKEISENKIKNTEKSECTKKVEEKEEWTNEDEEKLEQTLKRIAEIKKRLKELNNEEKEIKKIKEEIKNSNTTEEEISLENKENIKVFYADTIDAENNKFYNVTSKPGDMSFYKITFKGNIGTFTVRKEAEKRAISRLGNLEGCKMDWVTGGEILIIDEEGKCRKSGDEIVIDSPLKVRNYERKETKPTAEKSTQKIENMETVGYLGTYQDGAFYKFSKERGGSLFRMFNRNRNTANYELATDVIKKALANRDAIKEICKWKGPSSGAIDIKNIKPGKIELQSDGSWKVIEKAEIEFIDKNFEENEKINTKENKEEKKIKYVKTKKGKTFDNLSDTPDSLSFWRMYDIEGDTAKFDFYGNVKVALDNFNAVFDDVYDFQGRISETKKIITKEPGIAKFDEKKWNVIKEAILVGLSESETIEEKVKD